METDIHPPLKQIELCVKKIAAPSGLLRNPTPEERFDAALELAFLCGIVARPHLQTIINVLRKEQDYVTISPAIFATGGVLNPLAMYAPDDGTSSTFQASLGLMRQRIRDIYERLPDELESEAIRLLSGYLDESRLDPALLYASPAIREFATSALAFAGPLSSPALEQLQSNCKDYVKPVAIWSHVAVANITKKNNGVFDFLIGIMRDRISNAEDAQKAAQGVYYTYGLDRTPYLPDLLDVLRSGQKASKIMVSLTIGWILSQKTEESAEMQLALPFLIEALLNSDDKLASSLSGMFQPVGKPAIPILSKSLKDNTLSQAKRVRIAAALGLLGSIASETVYDLKSFCSKLEHEHERNIVSNAIKRVQTVEITDVKTENTSQNTLKEIGTDVVKNSKNVCEKCGNTLRVIKSSGKPTGNYLCLICQPSNGKCPLCKSKLRTERAQQCPSCLVSWH